MAWRIQDHVLRGEIDNRQPGRVRGRIWLKGVPKPLTLVLKGNAAPDLAGCLLTFENSGETYPLRKDAGLAARQVGTIGDLTASRKVRVMDAPYKQAARGRKKKAAPQWANCLYLEWYSEANGRVVIESTDFQLTLSPPAWRPSPKQEARRQKESAAGFRRFVQKLTDAINTRKHAPPDDKEWDEFDYEKLLRESDARTDKYGELLDKYRDHPDRERIIAREMGWTWLEEALEEEKAAAPGENERSRPDKPDDDFDPATIMEAAMAKADEIAPDPATEGVDWVRDEHGYPHHPLCLRAREGGLRLSRKFKELGLDKTQHEDLGDLLIEYHITSAKLAGALNSLAYGRDLHDGPFIVACLKRALGHLHAAQRALEKDTPQKMLPADTIASLRAEFFSLREEILRLMEEFRGKT